MPEGFVIFNKYNPVWNGTVAVKSSVTVCMPIVASCDRVLTNRPAKSYKLISQFSPALAEKCNVVLPDAGFGNTDKP